MLIVIEGPDLTGKTTLANLICDDVGAEYVHAGPPTKHPLAEYEPLLVGYRPGTERHLVVDRWHLGESVWPIIFKRESKLDPAIRFHIELLLASRGGVLVLADRSEESLRLALELAPDEPVTPDQVPHIRALFSAAAGGVMAPVMHYNFEQARGEPDRAIVAIARVEEHYANWPCAVTSEWIGVTRPEVLLVGDRFGRSRHEGESSVPFQPWRDASGHFLMSELLEVGLLGIAACNATRGDGSRERIPELWLALGRPPLVALGREAQRALNHHSLLGNIGGYHEVPHPQYWRRFERARGAGSYGELIRSAAAS